MSQYTITELNGGMVLRGMTEQYGRPWWLDRAIQNQVHTGHSGREYVGTTYRGAIPVADVIDRMRVFREDARSRPVAMEVDADIETMTHIDDNGNPVRWVVQEGWQGIQLPGSDQWTRTFSSGYQIHGYRQWLLNEVSSIMGDTLRISSVGVLRNGALAWVQVTPERKIVGPSGFGFLPHILATTSLDGKVATTYTACATFVECDNTYGAAMSEGHGHRVKVKHTRYSNVKVADARAALGVVVEYADGLRDDIEMLASIPVTSRQWDKIIADMAPVKDDMSPRSVTMAMNRRDNLDAMRRGDSRVAPWSDTGLGVLQLASTFRQWEAPANQSTNVADRRMEQLINGTGDKEDQAALSILARNVPAARELIGARG